MGEGLYGHCRECFRAACQRVVDRITAAERERDEAVAKLEASRPAEERRQANENLSREYDLRKELEAKLAEVTRAFVLLNGVNGANEAAYARVRAELEAVQRQAGALRAGLVRLHGHAEWVACRQPAVMAKNQNEADHFQAFYDALYSAEEALSTDAGRDFVSRAEVAKLERVRDVAEAYLAEKEDGWGQGGDHVDRVVQLERELRAALDGAGEP